MADDKWVIRLKVEDKTKFWAGPNVGSGGTGTSLRNARKFTSRNEARRWAKQYEYALLKNSPVRTAMRLQDAKQLSEAKQETTPRKTYTDQQKDAMTIKVFEILKKSPLPTTESELASLIAKELLTAGYRTR